MTTPAEYDTMARRHVLAHEHALAIAAASIPETADPTGRRAEFRRMLREASAQLKLDLDAGRQPGDEDGEP